MENPFDDMVARNVKRRETKLDTVKACRDCHRYYQTVWPQDDAQFDGTCNGCKGTVVRIDLRPRGMVRLELWQCIKCGRPKMLDTLSDTWFDEIRFDAAIEGRGND